MASEYRALEMPTLKALQGGTRTSHACLPAWISRILRPFHPSPQRTAIEDQLSRRESFPADSWIATGLPVGSVKSILDVLARGMEWPNHHFLPDDPIRCVLVEGVNEFGPWETILEVNRIFGSSILEEEIVRMVSDNWNLEELIRLILK